MQQQREEGGAQEYSSPLAQRHSAFRRRERGNQRDRDKDEKEPVTRVKGRGRLPAGSRRINRRDAPCRDQRQPSVNPDFNQIECPPRQDWQGVKIEGQAEKECPRPHNWVLQSGKAQ